jgi:hypothetical protein|tara:strand:+ start:685 stop:888 length:204 start_codon:yes stop_codon:yes gene_type:complete
MAAKKPSQYILTSMIAVRKDRRDYHKEYNLILNKEQQESRNTKKNKTMSYNVLFPSQNNKTAIKSKG